MAKCNPVVDYLNLLDKNVYCESNDHAEVVSVGLAPIAQSVVQMDYQARMEFQNQ